MQGFRILYARDPIHPSQVIFLSDMGGLRRLEKENCSCRLVIFFSGAAEEESWFRLLMGFFLFGTDTNVFPDPADGADDVVWILHIFVVGGQWMDG